MNPSPPPASRVRALLLPLALGACSSLGDRLDRARARDATLDSARVADSLRAAAPNTGTVRILANSAERAVSWSQIERMIRETPDSVRAVMQRHDRTVSLVLLDGRRYRATQPEMDRIIRLVQSVDPAGRILIATE